MQPFFFLYSVFEETNDPNSRSFFSEIISSISDVKFSHSGRYLMTRDYLSVKIWDLNMENRPLETYQASDCCPLKAPVMWLAWGGICYAARLSLALLHLHRRAGFDPDLVPLFNRCTNISGISCAPSMRMTAFSTSLSAVGMGRTGECLSSMLVTATSACLSLLHCLGGDGANPLFFLQHRDDGFLQQFLQDD